MFASYWTKLKIFKSNYTRYTHTCKLTYHTILLSSFLLRLLAWKLRKYVYLACLIFLRSFSYSLLCFSFLFNRRKTYIRSFIRALSAVRLSLTKRKADQGFAIHVSVSLRIRESRWHSVENCAIECARNVQFKANGHLTLIVSNAPVKCLSTEEIDAPMYTRIWIHGWACRWMGKLQPDLVGLFLKLARSYWIQKMEKKEEKWNKAFWFIFYLTAVLFSASIAPHKFHVCI